MLHRPRKQELIELLIALRIRQLPAQIPHHLPQVRGPRLLARPIPAQLAHRHPQPLRQPGHRRQRGRGDLVRHEPELRERAQLHRRPKPVCRTADAVRVDELDDSYTRPPLLDGEPPERL